MHCYIRLVAMHFFISNHLADIKTKIPVSRDFYRYYFLKFIDCQCNR
jgi:hypothetical protein